MYTQHTQSLPLVPLPTMPLPLDPSCAYAAVPTLADVGSRLGHAGGINAPKVVSVSAACCIANMG